MVSERDYELRRQVNDDLRKRIEELEADAAAHDATLTRVAKLRLDLESENRTLKARIKELEAGKACLWWPELYHDEETWHSACGAAWQFTADGPKENDVVFCHRCGGRVVIKGKGE